MKKILLVFLFCTSILFINQTAQATTNIDIKKEAGYISINGSIEKEVEPNFAKITFAIENTSSDAQKATIENNTISNEIIAALKQITNSQDDLIKTTNFSVRPVYATTGGKRVIKNYTAVNSVTVETKDTSKVSKLIDTAIASGANRVNGLTYGLNGEKKVCTAMYPEVVKDLKEQANALATAAGTTIDGLKHMSAHCSMDGVNSNGRFYAKNALADGAITESTQTPIETGKVKVRIYVDADFYVK